LTRASNISSKGKIKSICVQSGLWAIFKEANYGGVSGILYASGQADDRACTNDGVNGTNPQYKSIRHIGNLKLREAGISFYTGTFFTGQELYFNGFSLDLNEGIPVRSFGFTGKDNWTVFENPGNVGPSACLLSDYADDSKPYDAVVYNKDLNLTVGSIRRGCDSGEPSNQSTTVILPTGEIRHTGSGTGFKNPDDPSSFELKDISEKWRISSDGDELRLPRAVALKSTHNIQGDSNWTVFEGTTFEGKSRCFFSTSSSDGNLDENPDEGSPNPVKLEVGSIKRGCSTPPQRHPRILEDTQIPQGIDRRQTDKVNHHPANSIFFTSFLIGLGILIFVIFLGISIISYFYCKNRDSK